MKPAPKQMTIADIRSWRPCYDPTEYLPEGWSGSAIDLLRKEEIPFQDALWVLMRKEIVSDKLMRLFAVWCARQVQHLMKDQRSITAIDVAERFANGDATRSELKAARVDSRIAAEASGGAALEAVWAAADAATASAWDDAWNAVEGSAGWAASASGEAAEAAQRKKLIEMIKAELPED